VSTNRVAIVESNLDAYLESASRAPSVLGAGERLHPDHALTTRQAIELFEDQVLSRALDVAARELKKTNRSFYTISSAGHENNAILGALLRLDDPCFLHYRSGGLMMARSRKHAGITPAFDTLLSLCASAEDPISHGRHKVWGSAPLWVPPQTSTIASHLPKAVGLAFAIGRAKRIGLDKLGERDDRARATFANERDDRSRTKFVSDRDDLARAPIASRSSLEPILASSSAPPPPLSRDSIVCCSFGDASANHATALAGLNAARYIHRRGSPLPILFVCEDNGIGISVDTPARWIEEMWSDAKHIEYFRAEGEIDEMWDAMSSAIDRCRASRSPVFLHMLCTRLWGHAGSDVETTYRTLEEIETVEASDPLLRNARRLVELGAATPETLRAIVSDTRERVNAAAEEASRRPRLMTREQVTETLAPWDETRVRSCAARSVDANERARFWGDALPENAKSATKRTLAAHINSALHDEMLRHPEILVFGEDTAKKGGVYGVTQGLQKRFGIARVFDTLLDETSVLGIAQGAAHIGFLPMPEIQYLAYIHNALDQLRGEACSLSFFSHGQFTNPMVVRIQGLAYQKGFGGHFHNDDSVGALRDIPGLMLAVPSRGADAVRMLRGAIAAAKSCGRIVCFLEPIALYHEKDLYADGDNEWLSDYPPPPNGTSNATDESLVHDERDADRALGARTHDDALLPGDLGIYHADARDLCIVSYANGMRLSLRAARRLEREHGIRARVIDLRWLAPLAFDALSEHVSACSRLLVVDECRATGGGVADAIIAHFAEQRTASAVDERAQFAMSSVRAADSYVPLGTATSAVLVGEDDIVRAAKELCA
jgi:2-oxoisovalerate dehydrogenase E1 component